MDLMASIGTPSNSAIHAIDAASMSLTVAPLAMMARLSSSDSSSELPVVTMPCFSPACGQVAGVDRGIRTDAVLLESGQRDAPIVEHESITTDEHIAHLCAVARPTAGGAHADHEVGPTVEHGHVRVERGGLRADLVDTAAAIGAVDRDHHVESADPGVVPLDRQRADRLGQLSVGGADVFEQRASLGAHGHDHRYGSDRPALHRGGYLQQPTPSCPTGDPTL